MQFVRELAPFLLFSEAIYNSIHVYLPQQHILRDKRVGFNYIPSQMVIVILFSKGKIELKIITLVSVTGFNGLKAGARVKQLEEVEKGIWWCMDPNYISNAQTHCGYFKKKSTNLTPNKCVCWAETALWGFSTSCWDSQCSQMNDRGRGWGWRR